MIGIHTVTESDRSEQPSVAFFPEIKRDVTGRVQRHRVIVTLDIIPDGRDFRLDVLIESIPAQLLPRPSVATPIPSNGALHKS